MMSDAAIAAFAEGVRARAAAANLTPEQRMGCEFATLLTHGIERQAMEEGFRELGITPHDFIARFRTAPEELKGFLRSIFTLDVLLQLVAARDQELTRRIHQNDFRDLVWLSVAVPYANIVVSEKYWGHMVEATGLDKKHNTRILTDLEDLPPVLAELGCL